jgi:hypothetical protein
MSEMRRATWSGLDGRLVLRRTRRAASITADDHDERREPAAQLESVAEGDATDD